MNTQLTKRSEILEAAVRLLVSMVADPDMKITSRDEIGKKAIILLKQEKFIEPDDGQWQIIKSQLPRAYVLLYRSSMKKV